MVTFCGCHVLGGTPDVDIVSENYEKNDNVGACVLKISSGSMYKLKRK